MRSSDLLVEVRGRALNGTGSPLDRQGVVLARDLNLTAVIRWCDIGEWKLVLPRGHAMVPYLEQPASGIVVSARTGDGPGDWETLFSGPTESPERLTDRDNSDGTLTFLGYTDNDVLRGALAFPDPANPDPATQAATNDVRAGAAETIMRSYVSANIGPVAPTGRRPAGSYRSLLTMAPNQNRGPAMQKSPRFQDMLELQQQIALYAGLGFQVIQRGDALVFEVLTPADRSDTVRLSIDAGTLTSEQAKTSPPTLTRAIVAGQGEGTSRMIVQRVTTESLASEGQTGRVRERFIDQRNAAEQVELEQSGDEALLAEGYTATAVKVVPADDQTMRFMRDWREGERVGVIVDGVPRKAVVTAAAIVATPAGTAVGMSIGDTAQIDDQSATVARVEDTTRRVDNLERAELITWSNLSGLPEVFTTDPGADRLLFWDDSAGELAHLAVDAPLSINGNLLDLDTTALDAAIAGAVAAATAALARGRNRVLNGDMRVNQRRFTGGQVLPGSYCLDRWRASGDTNLMPNPNFRTSAGPWIAGGSNGSLVRMTGLAGSPVPGITTYSRTTWTGASGDGAGGAYSQSDVSSNVTIPVYPGETITLSAWVRSSVAKTVRAMTQYQLVGGGFVSSTPTVTVALSPNVWTRIVATFEPPRDARFVGAYIYPVNGQQWAAGNTFDTLGWTLTKGNNAPPVAFDGASTGGSWSGTANASPSYSVPTLLSLGVAATPQGSTLTINSGAAVQQIIERANVPAGTYVLSWVGTATARVYNRTAAPPAYASGPIVAMLDGLDDVVVEFSAVGGARTLALVQLEPGSVVSAFERLPIAHAELECRRYYRRWDQEGGAQTREFVFTSIQTTTDSHNVNVPLDPPMRVTPALTYQGLIATNAISYSVAVASAVKHESSSRWGCRLGVNLASASATPDRPGMVGLSSSAAAFLALDAEL